MSMSQTYASQILNAAFGISNAFTQSTRIYLGLCENAPDAATGAVSSEPTAASYARQMCGGADADEATRSFQTSSGGVIQNNKEIRMKTARQAWGNMNYWFISKSETRGSAAIIWGELKNAETGESGVTIPEKTVPVFFENELKASIDVELT